MVHRSSLYRVENDPMAMDDGIPISDWYHSTPYEINLIWALFRSIKFFTDYIIVTRLHNWIKLTVWYLLPEIWIELIILNKWKLICWNLHWDIWSYAKNTFRRPKKFIPPATNSAEHTKLNQKAFWLIKYPTNCGPGRAHPQSVKLTEN